MIDYRWQDKSRVLSVCVAAATIWLAGTFFLIIVVKDDSDRVPLSRAQSAHTVSKVDTIGTARTSHGPMVNGESHCITLAERNDLRSGLHSRSLFPEYKLTPVKSRCGSERTLYKWWPIKATLVLAMLCERMVPTDCRCEILKKTLIEPASHR